MPDAVRIGLALSLGSRIFLYSCGTAAIISVNLGDDLRAYFFEISTFNLFKLTSLFSLFCLINSFTISVTAIS